MNAQSPTYSLPGAQRSCTRNRPVAHARAPQKQRYSTAQVPTSVAHLNLRGRIGLPIAYSGHQLLLLAVASMTIYSGRLALPPLLPAIISDLAITPAEAGLGLSVSTAFAALGRYPGGQLADQLSQKTTLVAAFGTVLAGFGGLIVATTYGWFVLSLAAIGGGIGLYTPASLSLISDLYGDRSGRALGVNTAALNFGGIVGTALAIAALATVGWNWTFVPLFVFLGGVLAWLHWSNHDPYVVQQVQFDPRPAVKRLAGRTELRWLLVTTGLFTFGLEGFRNFLPIYLQATKGFSTAFAGGAFAGVYAIGIVVNPIAGFVGDRLGHVQVIITSTALCLIGTLVVLLSLSRTLVVFGLVLFAVGSRGYWPVMNAYVLLRVQQSNKAGDFGAMSTLYSGFGSIGSVYVGVAASLSDYSVAFAGLAVFFAVVTGLTAWLGHSKRV